MFEFSGWQKAAGKILMHAELYVSNLIWACWRNIEEDSSRMIRFQCVLPISDSEVTLNNMFTHLTISIFPLIWIPEIVNKRHAALVPVVSARHWLSSKWLTCFFSPTLLSSVVKYTLQRYTNIQIFYFKNEKSSTLLEIVRIDLFLTHEKPGATKTQGRHTQVSQSQSQSQLSFRPSGPLTHGSPVVSVQWFPEFNDAHCELL